jgi:putative ABC transport system permease protein
MAACIIILLFVFYEKSFDNFQTRNTYRLNEVQKFEGMVASQKVALSMFPMGPTLKNEFPEISNFTRIHWMQKFQITNGEKRVFLPAAFYVDSTFLHMFEFRLLKGNRETALQKPNSVVLTKTSARLLFGDEDPIGKTITHYGGDTVSFQVTGIADDVPANSQLQFNALLSFNTIYKPDMMNWWGGNWLDTYLELRPNTNPASLEKKFPDYLKRHLKNDNWKNYELFLLPFRDVHANANDIGLDYLNFQKFDKNYTRIFFAIAIIVLLIACINFMNLSTARSSERAKEVGIRKTIGAYRWQLGYQFLAETVLLSLIALLFAIGLVELALPYVSRLSQRDLHLPLFSKPLVLAIIVVGTIFVGIVSGLYPAAYLSSFQPVRVLKGSIQTGRNKSMLRNILVVCQFSSAIFLMISTILVLRQLGYMQGKDPGYNRDQVMTIPLDDITYRKFESLKQQLLNNTLVRGVTAAQDQLGSHLDQSGIEFKGEGPLRHLTSTRLIVDPDYLFLYRIGLESGNNFSNSPSANGREYIVNESLARELLKDHPGANLSSLIGKHFGFDSLGYIIGVAKDFNFNSLHYKIETMFLFNQKDWGYSTVSVKIDGKRAAEAIAFVQGKWNAFFPDHPFEYQFLDDHFEDLYRADMQVSRIVGILAGLAIIISCLGLFGLASYAAERRIREIGIRKVLGATVQNIVGLLSRHFLMLVLVANLIAWPLAWLVLHRWLQDYAYRTALSWWVFLVAGLVALLIAMATISFQAIRAAVSSPVKSLRTE